MLTQSSALAKDHRSAKSVPDMQHRHFAWIAGLIASSRHDDETVQGLSVRRIMAHKAADDLQHTNRNFDRDRFLAACDIWHSA